LPGHFAGTTGLLGHHSRYVVAAAFSRILVVAILACVALFIILLAYCVLGEIVSGFFSAVKARTAATTFLVGLGVLLTGIVIGVRIVDIVGACLVGSVLLGVILEYY
jgi:hypothetical protein